MNKTLHTLMQKEMTRKEFLATLGFGIATLLGFSSVIKLLTGRDPFHPQLNTYGSRSYGR